MSATGSFAAEGGGGDESHDQADWQGLSEGAGHVDEAVLEELLRVLDGSHLRGGGGGVKSGRLDPANLRGEVAVDEVGHEVEVEDLPRGDVAGGGDEGDQDAQVKARPKEADSPGEKPRGPRCDALVLSRRKARFTIPAQTGSGKLKDEVLDGSPIF